MTSRFPREGAVVSARFKPVTVVVVPPETSFYVFCLNVIANNVLGPLANRYGLGLESEGRVEAHDVICSYGVHDRCRMEKRDGIEWVRCETDDDVDTERR